MINLKQQNSKKYIFGILFIVFFTLIFLLNRMYPLHSDDWMYSFVFYEEPVRFINGVGDIFISQYNHYLYWGGRNVVHIIDQFLLYISPVKREIINSLAFVFFIWVIYKTSLSKNKLSISAILFAFFLVWIALPTFPQTVIWITGSSNYLWGTLIVLFFLYFYIDYLYSEEMKNSTIKNLLFLFGGIIAGWTNENLVVAFLFILVVFFLILKANKIKIPQWSIWGFCGVCIGCVFMLVAPGNFIRSQETYVALGLDQKGFGDALIFKARNIYLIYKYIPTVIGLIGAYILCLLIYIFSQKNKDIKVLLISFIFFAAAQISALAMIASPIFPVRASFCLHAFMIVAICTLYFNYSLDTVLKKSLNIIVITCLCIVFVSTYSSLYKFTEYLSGRYVERERNIESQKDKGISDIILKEEAIILPGEFDFEDITDQSDSWRNSICADYYKVKSIKRVSP